MHWWPLNYTHRISIYSSDAWPIGKSTPLPPPKKKEKKSHNPHSLSIGQIYLILPFIKLLKLHSPKENLISPDLGLPINDINIEVGAGRIAKPGECYALLSQTGSL